MRKVERRQLVPPEAQLVGATQHRVIENFEGDRRRGTEPAQELGHQFVAASWPWPRQEGDLRRTGDHARIQARHQQRQRLVPRDLGELSGAAIASAALWRDQPVGVVGDLHGRLTAYAQPALAEGVRRVTFELAHEPHARHTRLALAEHLGFAVHDPRRHAAAGRAQRAHARLPDRDARDQFLFGDEADDLVFGIAAPGQRRGGASDGGDLEEPSAVHGHHRGLAGISSDRSGSRSTPASACGNSRRRPCPCRRRARLRSARPDCRDRSNTGCRP